MKDYQAHLEKLRKDAAECALVRTWLRTKAKREIFDAPQHAIAREQKESGD